MTQPLDVPYQSPPSSAKPPRVMIGLAIIVLQWAIIELPTIFAQGTTWQFNGMLFGPMIGIALLLIWWLGFSRFSWATKITGVLAMAAGAVLASVAAHPSMKMGLFIFGLPVATTAWALWAAVASKLSPATMRGGLVIVLLGVGGYFALLRLDGLTGAIKANIAWRWSPTAEQRYLARRAADEAAAPSPTALPATLPATQPAAPLALSAGDWPSFRGANRNSVYDGSPIRTDWNTRPPKQLWRHPVGPGWSSFCVVGDHVFTQEQHGDKEAVVCYDLNTGKELWEHQDIARFEESMAGPGPRATPTFDSGRLYTLGARGTLNCLDPLSGAVIWQHDVAADSGAPLPIWGFPASPLIYKGLVTVITGGNGKSVIAYDAATGKLAWAAGDGWSYASTQVATLRGVDQLLLVTGSGLSSFDPTTGQALWSHNFPMPGQYARVVQPAVLNDHEVLLGSYFDVGTRKISVSHDNGAWQTSTVWHARKFRPYYNDLVIHKGFAYGFDGSRFVCVDLASGAQKWSHHDYGNGQVLLLPAQDLALVLAETGQAALVDAKPDEFHEVANFAALEGKTWNHPVIAHNTLLVRNGEEAAAYDLR